MAYLLVVIAGGLLALPFQFPNLALVSWIGLIPFLFALEDKTDRQAFYLGWLMGIIFLIISGKWLIYPLLKFSGYPWFICILILILAFVLLGTYWGLFAWITKMINQQLNLSLLIVMPLVWTGIEFLRTLFSFQYLFGFLGYSQSFIPELVQLAQYGGFYLISFLIVLVNTLLYLGLKKNSFKYKLIYILVAILVFGVVFSYGRLELAKKEPTVKELKVGLIQPNIPQQIKLDPNQQDEIAKRLTKLSQEVLNQTTDMDLLIWPETAILRSYDQDKKFPFDFSDGNSLLTGGFITEKENYLNSALLIDKNNNIRQTYSKNRLVPWGEYVPFPNLIPDFIESNLNHITPGTELQSFKLNNISWIAPICSEILNPFFVHKLYQDNDLIINISNEAWFERSKASLQILQAAIFRAVEYQVPVVKVGNTGISGIINKQGQIINRTKLFETTSLEAKLELTSQEKTIYQQIGYLFGKIILGVMLLLLLLITYTRYKKE